MDTPRTQLVRWFRAECKRRTQAIEDGTGNIDWILPEYRITWTEVLSKAQDLGVEQGNAVDFRLWWNEQVNKR